MLPFSPDADTSISDISFFFTPSNSYLSPRLLFKTSLETGSCRSDAAAGEYFPSAATFTPSPSESEPEAELLSDGERDGDFFSSFFFFFFFFLAACLLCFLDFESPSVSVRSVITSLFPSSFSPAWSSVPTDAASLAPNSVLFRTWLTASKSFSGRFLALMVLAGFGVDDGSTSDSAPVSELLSFSPFLFFFFFLLLCFLCFLFFLGGGSLTTFTCISSFAGASSSPEGISTAQSIVPVPLISSTALNVTAVLLSQHRCMSRGCDP